MNNPEQIEMFRQTADWITAEATSLRAKIATTQDVSTLTSLKQQLQRIHVKGRLELEAIERFENGISKFPTTD